MSQLLPQRGSCLIDRIPTTLCWTAAGNGNLSWRCAASFWTANRHYNNWKTGSCAALSSSQKLLSSTKAAVESCSPRWWSQSMATGWDLLESQPITLLNYLSQSHLHPKTLLLNNVLHKCAWTQWSFYKQIFTVEQQYKHSFDFTPRLNGCKWR